MGGGSYLAPCPKEPPLSRREEQEKRKSRRGLLVKKTCFIVRNRHCRLNSQEGVRVHSKEFEWNLNKRSYRERVSEVEWNPDKGLRRKGEKRSSGNSMNGQGMI